MFEDADPDKDVLAIPDTRPNFIAFVPYEIAVVLGVTFFALDTQLHSMVWGFIVLPFWSAAALMAKRDPNGVRVFLIRVRLALLLLDVYRWGGLSASPWPLKAKGRHAV